jgi:hypothetical protein
MCAIYGLFKDDLRYFNPGPIEYEAEVRSVMLKGHNWPFDPLKRKKNGST